MTARLPRAVAIVGPTGSGKAALGREAAARLGLPVLVCDSVKVYRGLDIGSAKPSAAALEETEHRLIDLVGPAGNFSAGDYARAAVPQLEAGRALFVGGTGLYLRAALWEATPEPGLANSEGQTLARTRFDAMWREREDAEPGRTHRALAELDPPTAKAIHANNWVRVVRALWLCEQAGEPISAVRSRNPPTPRARALFIVLDPGEGLRERLVRRTDRMLDAGWLEEVEQLWAKGHGGCKALRTLGYKQLGEVVSGRMTLSQAREDILRATWQYARRQRTYFRHQLPPEDVVHITEPSAMPWQKVEAFLASPPAVARPLESH